MPPRRGRPLAALAVVLAACAAPAAADGWAVLRELRTRLEAQPRVAEFRQEYLPAGFSSGDSETGRLTLALPGCLRWDYDEPFAKSYLLCQETVWTWNPDESSGRTFRVDPEADRGLDLLRLGVERLSERHHPGAAGPGGRDRHRHADADRRRRQPGRAVVRGRRGQHHAIRVRRAAASG